MMYIQRMLKRLNTFAPALALAASLLLRPLPARAQTAAAAFPANDTFRAISEPISVGGEAFAQRLAKIRAEGREPLGLVLAGGSARAYAHIGVLQALEEAGIRPDFIVANSMGAVVGMLYAAGMAPDTIAEVVSAVPPEYYFSLVVPTKGGVINADLFTAAIEAIAGRMDVAECPIPIIVTSEDLKTRRQVELSAGDFSKVMSTTFAMPAIFEPVKFGDYLLIDGGTSNLVPTDVAARYSSLLVVSTAFYDKGMDYNNLLSVLSRSFDIGKTRAGIKSLLAVSPFVIRNDVEHISYMQFSDPEAIIEKGRESARTVVGEIAASLPAGAANVPLSPELERKRALYRESAPKILAALKRGALPSVSPASRLKLRVKYADTFERQPLALDDQNYAGLTLAGAAGRTRGSFSSIVGLSQDAGRQWGLAASVGTNPVDTLRLDAEARLWGDFADWSSGASFSPASVEALAAVSWATKAASPVFVPSLYGAVEYRLVSGDIGWEARAQAEFDAGLPGKGSGAKGWASFLSVKAGAFADAMSGSLRGGPELTLKAGIGKIGAAALRARGEARWDVSNAGLAMELSDAFRGNAPSGSAPLVAVANLDLVWLAKALEFDIGEIMLVKNMELGPYLDCAWLGPDGGGAAPDSFAAGLAFSTTLSFAGLTPFDLSVFAGVDGAGKLVLGLRSDRLFPAFR